MRTESVLLPQSMSLMATMTFLRACGLSSGATASSRSRKTTSAAEAAAFSNSFGWLPGTANSLRLSRAGACSTILKLMGILALGCSGGAGLPILSHDHFTARPGPIPDRSRDARTQPAAHDRVPLSRAAGEVGVRVAPLPSVCERQLSSAFRRAARLRTDPPPILPHFVREGGA